ncbi:MAG: hypothetical protein ACWGQW_24980, partial [bacterium]
QVTEVVVLEPADDSLLQEISVFRELEVLSLDVSEVSATEIQKISQFKKLEFLQLSGGGKSIPIGWISSLKNLDDLYLFDLSASDADWQQLVDAKLPVKVLSFSHLSLDEMQGKFCGSLSSLSILQLTECKNTAAFWEGLSKNGSVRQFFLQSLSLDEPSMQALCRLSSLESFVIYEDVNLNSNQIRQLSSLHHLKYLRFQKCQLPDDESWEALSLLPNLEDVDLWGTSVGDACATALSKCLPITDLRLSATSLTDAGLEELQRLPHLKALEVGYSSVTPAGIRKFQKNRPDVVISPDPKLQAGAIAEEHPEDSE